MGLSEFKGYVKPYKGFQIFGQGAEIKTNEMHGFKDSGLIEQSGGEATMVKVFFAHLTTEHSTIPSLNRGFVSEPLLLTAE